MEKGKNKHGNGLTFVVFSETAVWERWKIQEKPMSFINLEVLLASWEMPNSMGSTLCEGKMDFSKVPFWFASNLFLYIHV